MPDFIMLVVMLIISLHSAHAIYKLKKNEIVFTAAGIYYLIQFWGSLIVAVMTVNHIIVIGLLKDAQF